MAYSEVPADLERTKWDSSYWQEYVNMSGYAAYMSASPNALIQTCLLYTSPSPRDS